MAKDSKISKQKGVEKCADLLFAGKSRAEIVQTLTKSYKLSSSAVDKWIKAARPLVEGRTKASEDVKRKEDAAFQVEAAKSLNITRERVLQEYAKIAFMDIREIFTVDGGLKPVREWGDNAAAAIGSVESVDDKARDTGEILGTVQKVKIWNKREALDGICRVMGYNAPTSSKLVDDEGKAVTWEVTLNLNK